MRNQPVERVDLGIVISLQEEFRELLALCSTVSQLKNDKLTVYCFNRRGYRIIAAIVGEAGSAQASRVTERMIDYWHPESIVSLGIAAGVHDDVRVGDVFVPAQADEYVQDAEFVFVPGGPGRRADDKLVENVRALELGHADIYKKFVDACADDLKQSLRDEAKRQQLVDQNIIRPSVAVVTDGHVATGPVVDASDAADAFTKWICGHDRNPKALDMETAGVFKSAQDHGKGTRVFAIRGIANYGDDRKKAVDEIGGGVLRKVAMRNAVRFLWALLDANGLKR